MPGGGIGESDRTELRRNCLGLGCRSRRKATEDPDEAHAQAHTRNRSHLSGPPGKRAGLRARAPHPATASVNLAKKLLQTNSLLATLFLSVFMCATTRFHSGTT